MILFTKSKKVLSILILTLFGIATVITILYQINTQAYHLRSEPNYRLSEKKVMAIIKKYNFYDRYKNPKGQAIQHDYQQQGSVIYDAKTKLYWQQSGSNKRLKYSELEKYINTLNSEHFSGFSGWRLPSLEEAMSLLQAKKNHLNLHIDPVFDSKQWWIWTKDQMNAVQVWVVYYFDGTSFSYVNITGSTFVRAVRSKKSP
ncbi:hypothetical protein MNBD_GAMMA22-230 [hydrothermal vent metagenome]|uniref:Lcl C-terminal domain-containing protein n=1 Tax=hydrothermal vent metagenome TaxID=652676 RepID=A0A3B1AFN2_9ZZZZ